MKYLRVFKTINDYESIADTLPYQCISCVKGDKKPSIVFPKYRAFKVQDGVFNVTEGDFLVIKYK